MQATVHHYDAATGAGSLLLDDGTALEYDAAAFRAGDARLLRPGQRVTVWLDGGRVVRVGLPPQAR